VTNFLYSLDYPIAQNGVVIMIGPYELMVKDACSEINSIFALSAIGFFYVHEFVRGKWVRGAILIASILPITVLANFFRVLALVLGAYYLGVDRIEGVFHDTLAQALGGGEENSTGMVNFVANTTALAVRFGCCVIAIHHVPLADEKRLRGHTSLNGGADALLLTERKNGGLTTILSLEKLKDEEDNIKLAVHLSRIVIGQDDDGDEVSTLVVTRVEPLEGKAVEKGKPPKAIPRSRRLLIEVRKALSEAGCDLRSFSDGPMVRAVHDEAVRLRYYARIAEEAAPDDTPEEIAERQRKGFNRAIKNALDAKDIVARLDSNKRFLWFP